MKINRHSTEEKNKTTAFWLHEFAYDLEKNAQNIDYLKDYLNKIQKGKQFNSIEEKLADIRSRVGLDLATKIANEMENIESANKISLNSQCCGTLPSKKCSCSVKTASVHSEKDVSIMGNILKYIEDMIRHEPHLDSAVIISRCKNEEGLRFNDLEEKIDKAKLIGYINNLLNSHKKNDELVSYTPSASITEYDADDRIAEYYNHAEPSRS